MKTDFLFTTWNCEECGKLKQRIREEAIFDDEFRGLSGQILCIVNVYSNSATESILDQFGFPQGTSTPSLFCHKGHYLTAFEEIEKNLIKQGFIDD
jgi:hypothetical protein